MNETCPPHRWTEVQQVVWLGWLVERRFCGKCGKLDVRKVVR